MSTPQSPDLAALRIRREDTAAREPRPRRAGRAWWWLLPLAVLLGAAGFFLLRARAQTFTLETAVASRVSPAAARSLLTATGYVVAQRQAAVASKGTGRLQILNVEEGDHVRKGDVIGRLESADVEAAHAAARAVAAQAASEVERARASAKEARLAFERSTRLFADSLASQSEYDAAEARDATARAAVQSAEAALRSAEANADLAAVQVENTIIRAPFDGTVLTKNADVGEVVAPFASSASSRGAVVTLADMGSLEVEADVSEANIRQVRIGQPCVITLDALPAEPYRGRVKKIVPTADRAKATVLTKLEFLAPDERVLPEMSAKVNFLPAGGEATSGTQTAADGAAPAADDTRTVLAVPATALVEREGRTVAVVIRGERARIVPVDAGIRIGGMVEIRRGLADSDIVALDPPAGLRDGSRIKPKS